MDMKDAADIWLPEGLLCSVEKPARYAGGEWNQVVKDVASGQVSARFAFCFPDTYEVGMSHLGMRILYHAINRREDAWCERVFAPWTDMEAKMRAAGVPLFALESRDPLSAFDFVGFTLQYELSYTNVLNMLDLGGVAVLASDRGDFGPLVCAGGPCACNPEPMADFIDFFVLGEGEDVVNDLLDLHAAMKADSAGGRVRRHAFLEHAAKIDGVYVPTAHGAKSGASNAASSAMPPSAASPSSASSAAASPSSMSPSSTSPLAASPSSTSPLATSPLAMPPSSMSPLAASPSSTSSSAASPSAASPSAETEAPVAQARKRVVADLGGAAFPDKMVVPSAEIIHDRIMLELFRGCSRGCRFCQAGFIYRPTREKPPETLAAQARALLASTGYEEIALTSLSTSDYSRLPELTAALLAEAEPKKVNLSLPSLRVDSFSLGLANSAKAVRKSGLTFAPEAGTQRLRDVINKGVREDDLLRSVALAFGAGWCSVKLYFMIGLPTEELADLDGIADLTRKVAAEFYKVPKGQRGRSGVSVTASVSSFVPKPFTPFQWEAQDTVAALSEKQRYLAGRLKTRGVTYRWHDANASFLEAALARGGRDTGKAVYEAWKLGCKFDSWGDKLRYDSWIAAFEKAGVDPAAAANRARGAQEPLPWDIVDYGVDKAFLWREREKAYAGALTPDCRERCAGCGVDAVAKCEHKTRSTS